jgi:hypothetical protein
MPDGACSCGNPDCAPGGEHEKNIAKHPRTRHGLTDASTDEAQIREWWTCSPSANIGIATGPESGIMVIDLDGDFKLPEAISAIPRTITAKTSRGRHLYLRYPAGIKIANKVHLYDLPIDVRGTGGYVVAPPSVHRTGAVYDWLFEPADCELADAPAALLDWLAPPSERNGKSQRITTPTIPASIPEGKRNATLMSLAGTMRHRGLGEQEILDALTVTNRRCTPPLPDEELRRIAQSVSRYSPAQGDATNSEFIPSVVASKLQANTNPLAWLWRGFITDKGITLFSALWKAGKTTLLAHLVRNMGKGEMLCDYEVTRATVLYITEESESRWAKRRDALGIGDNVHFLCRPFKAKPGVAKWHAYLDYVAKEAERIDAHLIVLDTISALWPVHNENDAGEVQAALMPLWNLTERSAVLLAHHLKKADGAEATGSRGSGALTGFVDTIVEFRRHDPRNRHCRKRIITGYGRDDETPAELVVELDAETNEYRSRGDRKAMKREEIKRTLFTILPTDRPGFTLEEIKEAWPEEDFSRKAIVLETLAEGAERGDWTRDGTGKKGHPYRYFVPSSKTG